MGRRPEASAESALRPGVVAIGLAQAALLWLAAASATASAQVQGYADYHGDWYGTLTIFMPARSDARAPLDIATPVELSIAADGGVSGRAGSTECRIAGGADDYQNRAHAAVALNLSGCRLHRLDGRYRGLLLTSLALEHASLRLKGRASFDAMPTTISGILRR